MRASMGHVLAMLALTGVTAAPVSAQDDGAAVASAIHSVKTQAEPMPADHAGVWTQNVSENFVLRGEIAGEEARGFLVDLELFRAGFLPMLGGGPAKEDSSLTRTPVTTPFTIFVINNDAQAARLLGSEHAAGFYQKDLSGPVLVLNAKAGLDAQGQARLLALRSVADHMVTESSSAVYPPWLREGLVEYISVSEILDNQMHIGLRNARHDYLLRGGRWIRMRDIVQPFYASSLERGFQSDDDVDWYGQFSAQSWLAVSYIMSEPGLAASIPEYLSRIHNGQAPRDAFKSAFGMSDKRFEKRMRAYWKAGQFTGDTMTITDAPIAVKSSSMTPAQKDFYFGRALMSAVIDGDSLAFAENHMANVSAAGSLKGEILAARAMLAAQKGDLTAADVHMAAALKSAPNSIPVRRAAGDIAMAQFGESRDPEILEDLRRHAEIILAQNPNDGQAGYFYAAACAALECPANKAAHAALNGASSLLEYTGANLNLISVLLEAGNADKALAIARIAAIWGESPEVREGGALARRDIREAMKTSN